MSIFSKLKLAKTSKDLEKSVEEIDADILTCEAEIKALEDDREKVIFEEGETAFAELQRQLAAKRQHVDVLQIARRGALARQVEAAADEKKREQESRYREALKHAAEERRLLKQWHQAAQKLAQIMAEIEPLQRAIRVHNEAMAVARRPDLVLPGIVEELQAKRKESMEKYYSNPSALGMKPTSYSGGYITVDILHMAKIDGYWPVPKFDPGKDWKGPPLALLD
jgi:hypothetical protein